MDLCSMSCYIYIYIYIYRTHYAVYLKLTQHYKSTILKLKNINKIREKERRYSLKRSIKEKLKAMWLVMPPGTKMTAQLLADYKAKAMLFRDHQILTRSTGGLG